MLELINVCKTFNPGTVNAKTALNDLNLTLNDGDFVTVIGGNGAGKSTMLNAIAGSFQIDSGKIVIDGTDVTGLPEHKRAALLGRVFQDPMMGTAPTMQIEENLALAARRGQHRGLKWGITKAERAEYQTSPRRSPPASGKSQLPQLFPCRHHKLILSYYPPSMNFEQKPSPAVSQLYFIRLSTLFFLKSA